MSDKNRKDRGKKRAEMPSVEKVQEELAKAENMDDFFGRDGIFARLFAIFGEDDISAYWKNRIISGRRSRFIIPSLFELQGYKIR